MTTIDGVVLSRQLHSDPRLYAGVRTRRILAFLVDVVFIAVLFLIAALAVGVAGVLTFGLAWFAYAILWPAVALLYNAFTVGGRSQATPGMRMMGLRVISFDGSPVNPVVAAAHAVLFYLSWTILTPFVLVVSLLSERKRLLHDIVLGTAVVNADELASRAMRRI